VHLRGAFHDPGANDVIRQTYDGDTNTHPDAPTYVMRNLHRLLRLLELLKVMRQIKKE
jgi:hypothetical protein